MTRRTRTTFLILAAAAMPAAAIAQPSGPRPGGPPGGAAHGPAAQAAGRISGTVVHAASGLPVPSASIAVRSARDSSLVGGGYTRADGTFRVDGLRPGSYTVRVRGIGFAPLVKAVVVTPAQAVVELGKLPLTPVAAELSSVTVTATQEAVALAPDRNSYTVKDMPAASGGSAVDVLRNVPSVEVDGDNKVSLRGNENVVVQLNGRATPMRGDALGNFLAQLPANMVAKVEVVPNPSAKNDPEGMAGIINIVLKENTDLGLSGGVTLGGGTTGQVNGSGNLGYQHGALTLFGNYGYMQDDRATSGYTDREGRAAGLQPYLQSTTTGAFTPKSHSLNASANYKLDAKDALSSDLIVSKRDLTRENDNLYRALDATYALTGRSLQNTTQTDDGLTLDWALAYKRSGTRPGDALATEFRVNRTTGDGDVRLMNQALQATSATDASAPPLGAPGIETDATAERTHNYTLQSDYTRTLGTRTKFEAGYKGTLRQLDNDYAVANWSDATSALVADTSRSNAFAYDEQVHAAYAVLSQGVGKFDLQGGVRAEHASTRFDLATTGERFDNAYNSLYPSAIAAYNVDDRRQLKISYSKRVTRPDTRQLNPFGFREDAMNVFQGNPALKPEYTHAFELGYQQSFGVGTVQLTPFVRHTVNAVRFIRTVDDAGVSTTTFKNVATSDSYGADANGSLHLGRLTGFGGVSAYRQVTDGSNLSTDVSNSAFGWSARANATLKVTKTLDAQGFVMYRAGMRTEQGRMSAMTMTNLALRQKLRGDAASVTLRVMDPFNAMKMGFVTDDGRFYQTSQRNFGARGLFLSFNYAFGRQPRQRQRAPEQPDATQPGPDGRIP